MVKFFNKVKCKNYLKYYKQRKIYDISILQKLYSLSDYVKFINKEERRYKGVKWLNENRRFR